MKRECYSSHGGAGYADGSYWDGDAIVCGACGHRIVDPAPTGGHAVMYSFREHPPFWLLGRVKRWEPTWPEFIGGKRHAI